jgi:hypothetical protein
MRKLAIKVLVFLAILEGLRRVDLPVLLLALGLGIAAIVCADLLVTNPSSRAQ